MKRFIKVAAWLIAIIAVVLTGIYLYWDREQKIDFAEMLPDELEYCDRTIGRDTAEYIELKDWFKTNKKGWRNTPVTYVPKQTYYSPKLSINVLVGGVVVNYEAESGRWSQVIKKTEKGELPMECQNANKSLLPTPLTPLAFAPGVKGSLAALGAAEFNRYM